MARWYIIHAYSGFENKVKESILSEAERKGLDALVEAVEVPHRTVTEVKRGKKVQVERKFMPGYVLAKLTLNDDVYHLVKNTPKVTGFLGPNGKPQPITEREAARYFGAREAARPRRASTSASITRSAIRSRCSTARSPASTAWSRNSISTRTGSRSRFRSSAAPPRWNSTSSRSNW
jgi:transcription antitermination factor NusG